MYDAGNGRENEAQSIVAIPKKTVKREKCLHPKSRNDRFAIT
jgi:hypothetical protein